MKKGLIKIFAIILIVFGIFGIIGSVYGYIKVRNYEPSLSLEGTSGLTNSIQGEFQAMSQAMSHASIASNNAATSIESARDSLSSASVISYDIGSFFFTINSVWKVVTLGLGGDYFTIQGNKFNDFSDKIVDTSSHLTTNAQDMRRLSADLSKMSTNLNEVSYKFNSLTTGIDLSPFIRSSKFYAKTAMVYIGVLHIMFLLIGLVLYFDKNN